MSEEFVGNQAAAAYVGLPAATWRNYVSKGMPPPPHRREHSGGHSLPVWTRAQLDEWMATRPGRGAPGRPRRKRQAA